MPCFRGAQISLHPVSAPLLTETWERLGAEPRAFPARSERGCAACALCAPVTLPAQAPRGGDSVPLISRCAHCNLPQLGEDRVRSPDEETSSPPRKFHLVLGGGEAGGNATPAGPGAARGRQEGRGPISPSGWCRSAPQRSRTGRPGGRTARQTDAHVLGRAGEHLGRVSCPRLPPRRGRAAAGRARRCPAESRAG